MFVEAILMKSSTSTTVITFRYCKSGVDDADVSHKKKLLRLEQN